MTAILILGDKMMSYLNIKPVVFLMACLCLLMTISCVSASEMNGMGNVTSIDDAVSSGALASPLDNIADGNLAISSNQMNGEKLVGNSIEDDVGTFNDLNEDFGNLEGDGHYYVEKDYVFNGESDNEKSIININTSYVTIYGNGHTIDANGSDLAKFIVSANNVIIYDLIFKNFNASGNGDTSHILWNGDDGCFVSCRFYNNIAPNGGALAWNGNKGYIEYCHFENNTALNRGGAIYVTGGNNTIDSTTFRKFISPLSDEAIYFSGKNEQVLNIKSSVFSNEEISDKPIKVLWDEGCIVLCDGVDLSYESFDILCKEIENLKSGDYYILERDYVVSNTI